MPSVIHFAEIAVFNGITPEKLQELIEDSSFDLKSLKIEKTIFIPDSKHW